MPQKKTSVSTGKKVPASNKAALVLHGITITHPDRVIFDQGKITKVDIARYYAEIAPFLLAEIKDRPISLLRCPSGTKVQCFFQRNVGFGLGPDVHPFDWVYKGSRYKYIFVKDARGIMEMIQMGVIEIHPWGASVTKIHTPDRMIFDFDPDPAVPFNKVKAAALELRRRLKKKGLDSQLKCTGGKGLHVIVPLAPKYSWAEVKAWAAQQAQEMVRNKPDLYIATMTKAKRAGKIFIDYFRNDYTATAIAAYSLRARPGAPVAIPLEWRELKNLKGGGDFDMQATITRTRKRKLPKAPPRQRLPEAGKQTVEK